MKVPLFIAVFVLMFDCIHGRVEREVEYANILIRGHKISNDRSHVLKNLAHFDDDQMHVADSLRTLYKKAMSWRQQILDLAKEDFNVSSGCQTGIKLWFDGLGQKDMWAFQMLDAFAKVPSGVLDIDFVWPGQYDECVNITTAFYDNDYNMTFLIRGKYFRTELKSPFEIPVALFAEAPFAAAYLHGIDVGICLPDACDESDVKELIDLVFYIAQPILPADYQNTSFVEMVIHPETSFESTPETITAIVFCSIIGILMLVGTLYDVCVHHDAPDDPTVEVKDEEHETENTSINAVNYSDETHLMSDGSQALLLSIKHKIQGYNKICKFLMAFSMYTSGSKMLNTDSPPKSQVQAVTGIRVLSLGWIILGHTYLFAMPLAKNAVIAVDWIQRWTFQIITNTIFAVDSFFLLSGLLVSYLTLNEMKKRDGKINWLMFYFHRFWRLTPAYMLIMLVYVGFFQYWGSGPFWPKRAPGHDFCTKYWWRNFLYIQNFWSTAEECMGWTWYLANDMQFFILTPLILFPLYKRPAVGYIIIAALLVEQFVIRGVLSSTYGMRMNWPPPDRQLEFLDEIYQRPYARIGPYLIGILTGFLMWKTDRKVNIPKPVVFFCWTLSLVCISSVIFGTVNENRGHVNSVKLDAFINSISKTVWSFGLAWIIFACNTGYGGFVNTFLSSGLWGPLGRLNYCAYLIHPILMYIFILNQRYSFYYSDINMIYLFLGHWLATYVLAFFISMAFEAPMIGLERLLLPRSRK